MTTIKWKETAIVSMRNEEEDWTEQIENGETFDIEKIELISEDSENGDVVEIYNEDVVITANSQWFEIQK